MGERNGKVGRENNQDAWCMCMKLSNKELKVTVKTKALAKCKLGTLRKFLNLTTFSIKEEKLKYSI